MHGVRCVVFDLDGVLRRFDPAPLAAAEVAAGLHEGAVLEVAFMPELLDAVVVGKLRDEEWRAAVARRLSDERGVDGDRLVAIWSASAGEVVPEVLAVVRALRDDVPVALLTNATDRLPRDLDRLGLAGEVDVVFNTSELGVAKPDPAVFAAVAGALDADPAQLVFVDDTAGHVAAAAEVGFRTHRFRSATELRAFLAAEGLLPAEG